MAKKRRQFFCKECDIILKSENTLSHSVLVCSCLLPVVNICMLLVLFLSKVYFVLYITEASGIGMNDDCSKMFYTSLSIGKLVCRLLRSDGPYLKST